MLKLNDYFPEGYEARDSQKYILEKLDKFMLSDKKFAIISAPTGAGKSFISATLSNYSKNPSYNFINIVDSNEAFKKDVYDEYINKKRIEKCENFGCTVLTTTKLLQNQYKSLFKEIEVLKGKQNYTCAENANFDCDFAPCLLYPEMVKKCLDKGICQYQQVRNNAIKAKFSISNYNVFLHLPDFLRKRQFLVCDEASELEDILVNHHTFEIDYNELKTNGVVFNKLTTEENCYVHAWLNDLYSELQKQIITTVAKMTKGFGRKDLKNIDQTRIKKYKFLKATYDKVSLLINSWYDTEFVIEYDAKRISITPLEVSVFAQELFKSSSKVILMSATIINHHIFAKTLGIDDYDYIEVQSEFLPDKSPIYFLNKIKLNHSNMDSNLPLLLEYIKKICNNYKEKGIIHTHTHKITSFLQSHLTDSRFLFREEGSKNEKLLEEHRDRTDDTILVSPSLAFGVDLYDKLSRFQIIVKTPFPPLGNKRIKILFDRNKAWYESKCLTCLIQMCGRSTRHKDDYADTYILDASAIDLIKRNDLSIPRYFLDRIV